MILQTASVNGVALACEERGDGEPVALDTRARCEAMHSPALISGEARIGKTSLAQTVARQARETGAMAAVGRCYRGSAPASRLWQDLLNDLALSGPLDSHQQAAAYISPAIS